MSVLAMSACVVSDILPDLQEPTEITITIDSPIGNEVLNCRGQSYVRATVSGLSEFPGTLQIMFNDTLFIEKPLRSQYDMQVSEHFTPAAWAKPGTTLVITLTVSDAKGITVSDSVMATLSPYLENAPIPTSPANHATIIIPAGTSLPISWYYYPSKKKNYYLLCVDRDSAFSNPEYIEPASSYPFPYTPPAPGRYYWRVRFTGEYEANSPWSKTQTFTILNDFSFSTETQALSSVERVVDESTFVYLLGSAGRHAALIKWNRNMEYVWAHTFYLPDEPYGSSPGVAVDCSEREDGSLYVAVRPHWLFLLAPDGREMWRRELGFTREISAIEATPDSMLLCGFTGPPYIAKIDTLENVAWSIESADVRSCLGLEESANTGGYNYLMSNIGTYIVGEIDLQGTVSWEHRIASIEDYWSSNYVLQPIGDNEFIIGSTVGGKKRIELARISESGQLAWHHVFRPDSGDSWRLGGLVSDDAHSAYLCGTVRHDGHGVWPEGYNIFLISLDQAGDVQLYREYGSLDAQEFGMGLADLDGTLSLFGHQGTDSPGALGIIVDRLGDAVIR